MKARYKKTAFRRYTLGHLRLRNMHCHIGHVEGLELGMPNICINRHKLGQPRHFLVGGSRPINDHKLTKASSSLSELG